MQTINIAWLYDDLLELYGDSGNIKILEQRAIKRNIKVNIHRMSIGQIKNLQEMDMIFLGGGSDLEQNILAADLANYRQDLIDFINNDKVVLLVCGGYQLFGNYYLDQNGHKIKGLEILDFISIAKKETPRMIGYIGIETSIDQAPIIVGFENHSGQTILGSTLKPFGKVIFGHGNQFGKQHQDEGVRFRNCFGTYIHGPLLARNVDFADYLISLILKNKGNTIQKLTELNDEFANKAREVVINENQKK